MSEDPGRNRFLLALVFVVGSASLGAEITAARLMAPFFGASTIVWANTIGVVLVALSVGYWLGGRVADRHPNLRGLCLLVMAAAVLIAVVPFVARPFLDISVDALDSISAGAFAGSLVGVLALVSVPVVLLGAASPYAIRLAVPDVEHSGRVAGRLYAVSTAGSLVGTMLSALVLIPFVGTQRTFIAFGVALGIVAAAGLGWRFLALPAGLALVAAIPVGTVKATTGERVIHEEETRLQYARVVETPYGVRWLELNEGQAAHSVYRPGSYLTGGEWDGYLVLPFAALGRAPRRMAMLGNAGGTTARAYGHYFPGTLVDAAEIDPALSAIGRRYFDMRNPKLTVYNEDARPFLRRSDGDYDLIAIDAYRQPYIPFYLATREFFRLARDRLAPGGAVIVNVAHPEGNPDLEKALSATLAAEFPVVVRDPLTVSTTMLLATSGRASPRRLRAAIPGLPRDLRELARRQAAMLGPTLPGGDVYTDDRAPVEWLIDRSILGYAADQ